MSTSALLASGPGMTVPLARMVWGRHRARGVPFETLMRGPTTSAGGLRWRPPGATHGISRAAGLHNVGRAYGAIALTSTA